MRLGEYQIKAHNTATVDDVDVYSLGLIGEAGSVASAIKKFKRDAPAVQQLKRAIAEELGDTLWYLAEIATRFDLKLEDIAAENIAKTEFLFNFGNLNDSDFPSDQRFPRELDIRFDDDGTRLQLFRGNEPIGAPLTDNAYDDDGYRYHDAVHLAYMTVLGWSPVMRSLLKCKRKSKRKVDEVEDGARARALEEGISIMVFSQSKAQGTQSLFADLAQVPFWLLENIKKMTTDIEVKAKSVTEWRTAIAEGFKLMDQLRTHKGGIATCNLDVRTLTFRPPES